MTQTRLPQACFLASSHFRFAKLLSLLHLLPGALSDRLTYGDPFLLQGPATTHKLLILAYLKAMFFFLPVSVPVPFKVKIISYYSFGRAVLLLLRQSEVFLHKTF